MEADAQVSSALRSLAVNTSGSKLTSSERDLARQVEVLWRGRDGFRGPPGCSAVESRVGGIREG